MFYTVTIKNDAEFSNGHGIVHTWLELNSPENGVEYFGFSPKNDFEYFNVEGEVDEDNYLKTRGFSESITLEITKAQYEAMADEINNISKIPLVYDLMPDDNSGSDYNCTTMARHILESGNVDFLSGVQSPFGVAGRINGIAADVNGIKVTESGEVIIDVVSLASMVITLDAAVVIDGKNYDIGLVENILDAKDFIDDIANDTYRNISDYVKTLMPEDSTANNSILNDIAVSLDYSKSIIDNILDLVGNQIRDGSSWFDELFNYYQQGLQNYAYSVVYFLTGGTIPLGLAGQCLFPPGVTFPGTRFPGLIPPEGRGPDMRKPENTTSPIILDLDGDGIETRALQDGIFFDHDGNQFAENTGWAAVDDGLLVLDRNSNGVIDSGCELFGNNTTLNDGSLAKNGYQALQELDLNQDGMINAEDAAWQQLNVWQDRNGNAQVDDKELLTLEEAGIAVINTGYQNTTVIDEQGNAHKQTGTIIMQDGSIHNSADVWFAANLGYTRYTQDVVVSRDVRQLPYIRGFGNMTDLHIAMSQNSSLREMVEQFIASPYGSDAEALLQKIIFTWAGVADVPADSRGSNIDGRRLAALEMACGDDYLNVLNGTTDPLPNAAKLLNEEFNRFAQYIEASLLSQSIYRDDFAYIGLQIKNDLSGLTLNFDAFETHLAELKKTDYERFLRVSNVIYDELVYSPQFSEIRNRLGIPENITFFGTDNNDSLYGNNNADYLWGGAGDDSLNGGKGNDILVGGTNNDYMRGDYGSDTYLFNAGDGQDIITEGSSNNSDVDILHFGEGLLAENAILQRSSNNLVISFKGSDDQVTIVNYTSSVNNQIEQIIFADGTAWDVAAVESMLLAGTEDDQKLVAFGTGSEIHAAGGDDTLTGSDAADKLYGDDGDDRLTGGSSDDELHGGAGNDVLDAGSWNDVLEGGAGNDRLYGDTGSDTYLFNAGDGQDTITEGNSNSGNVDTLRFGEGLLAENAILTRSGGSLVITFNDSPDQVTITNYITSPKYQVEEIIFADGTVWDVATVERMLQTGSDKDEAFLAFSTGSEIHAAGGDDTLTGSDAADKLYGDDGDDRLTGGSSDDELHGGAGNDVLNAGSWNDVLEGGAGNDRLYGDTGSDTYLFNAGDGQDTITEGNSNSGNVDTLSFGEGLLAENVILTRSGGSLVISFNDSPDQVTITNYITSPKHQVEEIIFADGTVWDVATVERMLQTGSDKDEAFLAFSTGSEIHGAGGNDTLTGSDAADKLYGDDGDDRLTGGSSDDELHGGAGNDRLYGDTGSDTYLFNAGDGQDTITEGSSNSGNIDTLSFGECLQAENAIVQRKGNNLVITFAESTDSVTISDFFYSVRYQVEHITFADGTDWLPQDILNYTVDNIPLPISAPADTPVPLQRVREQIAAFMASDDGDEESTMGNMPVLSTSRISAQSLMQM
ncbi:hypothetical protein JGC56_12125 [Salmonella enterica subsp. enterica serovar Saintpaul]|nr:hypothetical protein [Salmonella enterica subsp. enterica serovar Saintpaul]